MVGEWIASEQGVAGGKQMGVWLQGVSREQADAVGGNGVGLRGLVGVEGGGAERPGFDEVVRADEGFGIWPVCGCVVPGECVIGPVEAGKDVRLMRQFYV